jgi:hypothetical protein
MPRRERFAHGEGTPEMREEGLCPSTGPRALRSATELQQGPRGVDDLQAHIDDCDKPPSWPLKSNRVVLGQLWAQRLLGRPGGGRWESGGRTGCCL